MYLVAVAIAAVASFGIYLFAGWDAEQKAAEFEAYKTAAGVQITQANARAEQARTDAALANERAAELEKQAAEARERTAITEQEVAATNFRIANFYTPRVLSKEQQEVLLEICVFYPGTQFDVGVSGSTGESLDYGKQIAKVLSDAGWIQRSFSGMIGFQEDGILYGEVLSDPGLNVVTGVGSSDIYNLIAANLTSSLFYSQLHVKLEMGNNIHFGPNIIHILVGAKTL